MSCSEFSLINYYFATRSKRDDDVVLGIGDDAALLHIPEGCDLVVTTDTMVAGVHFPLSASATDIGHKLLAVNLSDLAAMGAIPRWASLAISLPEVDEAWLSDFCAGFFSLADLHDVVLIGGDTTRGPLTLTVTLQGLVPTGQALRRSKAVVGDSIYVSGQLGNAGLALQHELGHLCLNENDASMMLASLHRPQPRVSLGMQLRGIANSAIDISDGLLADLGHILEASQVAADIQLNGLPLSAAVQDCVKDGDWSLPLAAGDDYELCFTVAAGREHELAGIAGKLEVPISKIGSIMSGNGLRCFDAGGQLYSPHGVGYEHFSALQIDEAAS